MTLGELIAQFRVETKDQASPPFWSDETLAYYATEGETEACRRGDFLRDSTSSLAVIPVSAGDSLLKLDRRVRKVLRYRLASETVPLNTATTEEMDRALPGWEDQTGRPRAVVTDYQTGSVRLWPIPDAADELRMTVVRLPLRALASDDDEPELRAEYHHGLIDWMVHRAFNELDSDRFDPHRSAAALARFTAEFGRRSSARNEAWQRDRIETLPDPIA